MEYPVIVERKNGIYKALIPDLSDLSAEGTSSDEAVRNVQRAAEAYLSNVEVRTIRIQMPVAQSQHYSTAQDWIEAAKVFEGDEEALQEHFLALEAERQRQRDEAQNQDDE